MLLRRIHTRIRWTWDELGRWRTELFLGHSSDNLFTTQPMCQLYLTANVSAIPDSLFAAVFMSECLSDGYSLISIRLAHSTRGTSIHTLMERGISAVEYRTRNQVSPGSNPLCYVSKIVYFRSLH